MASEADIDRVWEIMEDISICMVTTHAGGKMRARDASPIWARTKRCR